tara:strand:- start:224 stop:343 length:120 start_codon:yes stop_codon:yes gene_type:complete
MAKVIYKGLITDPKDPVYTEANWTVSFKPKQNKIRKKKN